MGDKRKRDGTYSSALLLWLHVDCLRGGTEACDWFHKNLKNKEKGDSSY